MIAISTALAAFFNSRPLFMLCADLITITLKPGLYAPSTGASLRFTSSLFPVTIGGVTWQPGPPNFKLGTITRECGVVSSNTQLRIQFDDSVKLAGVCYSQRVVRREFNFAIITIERAYSAGPGKPWIGKVPRCVGELSNITEIGATGATFEVRSMPELLNVEYPRTTIMAGCNKILYGADCGVAAASFTTTGAILSGSTVNTLLTNLTAADEYFDEGVITFTSGALNGLGYWISQYRNASGKITLNWPALAAPAAGDTFTIQPGCDHTLTTCTNRFSNAGNFGGHPYVPQPEVTY